MKNDGILEDWNAGMMEYWNDGILPTILTEGPVLK